MSDEAMREVLATLPHDLRPAAESLWLEARQATPAVTETLMMSYRVLRHVRGDPAALATAAEQLSRGVVDELDDARDDIDETYPAVTSSWRGGGADAFRGYMTILSEAVDALADGAAATAEAVRAYHDSVVALWTQVIERTERTGVEVVATKVTATTVATDPSAKVIGIVEDYATFVEELADALLHLTADTHRAGQRLSEATLPSTMDTFEGHRLPTMSATPSAGPSWQPSEAVTADVTSMAKLTAALSDSADCWQQAAHSNSAASAQLTPETMGLAGSHFYAELQAVLERDRELYTAAPVQLDGLADALRSVAVGYTAADEATAAELRRGQDES